jgi:hypothetical protein
MDQILDNIKTLNDTLIKYMVVLKHKDNYHAKFKLYILNSLIGKLNSHVENEYIMFLKGESVLSDEEKKYLEMELREKEVIEKFKPYILQYMTLDTD